MFECNYKDLKKELDKLKEVFKNRPTDRVDPLFLIEISEDRISFQFALLEKVENDENVLRTFYFKTSLSGKNNGDKGQYRLDFNKFCDALEKCKENVVNIDFFWSRSGGWSGDGGYSIKICFGNKTKTFLVGKQEGDLVKKMIKTQPDSWAKIIIPAGVIEQVWRNHGKCIGTKKEPYYAGFYFDKNEDGTWNVAGGTGMRVCYQTFKFDSYSPGQDNRSLNSIFFTSRSFKILQLLDKSGEDLEINYDGNWLHISCSYGEYVDYLLDRQFPKYRSVIPGEQIWNKTYTFDIKTLIENMEDCKIKSGCSYRESFCIRQDNCTITYKDGGDVNTNVINCNNISKTDMDFMCNWSYLVDILKSIKDQGGSVVKIGIGEPDKPLAIDGEGCDAHYLLCPYVS